MRRRRPPRPPGRGWISDNACAAAQTHARAPPRSSAAGRDGSCSVAPPRPSCSVSRSPGPQALGSHSSPELALDWVGSRSLWDSPSGAGGRPPARPTAAASARADSGRLITGALLAPVATGALVTTGAGTIAALGYAAGAAILITVARADNIERLRNGTERRLGTKEAVRGDG